MSTIHESVSTPTPPQSAFDLSHQKTLSLKIGGLYPVLCEEALPGDQLNINTELFIRLAPMIAPVMGRINATVHHFFVPNRIIWDEWEDFITGGDDGTLNPVMPMISTTNQTQVGIGGLGDYMGLPCDLSDVPAPVNDITFQELPFRAYQMIYNEYYRDENLQAKIEIQNPTQADLLSIRSRSYTKDYFTSALPEPQKGPDVLLSNTVQYKAASDIIDSLTGNPVAGGTNLNVATQAPGILNYSADNVIPPAQIADARVENIESIQAGTIEELRQAARLQEYYEILMRGGSRYKEFIKSFFNVNVPDGRLQRPDYIGGGKTSVVISEVLNTTGIVGAGTAPEGDGGVQGNMSGHGISVGSANQGKYFATEHGWFISILSVLPEVAYMQGVQKKFTRTDRLDYYNYKFANLGEQEVRNDELYHDWVGDATLNDDTFGYQQRYAEYKQYCSGVSGDFRKSLSHWTTARIFATRPNLNAEFIEADQAEFDRLFAVSGTDTDPLWCQLWHSIKMKRRMPYFANPTL